MISLEDTLRIIKEKIATDTVFTSKQPPELFEPLEYFVKQIGGKRLRPAVVLLAHSLYKDTYAPALGVAMAVEYFHNFTLIHDDIMDKADLRRGHPTIHTHWDTNTAILTGDALMIIAYEYLSKVDSDKFGEVFSVFNQMALEVCQGQQYDMNFEQLKEVSEDEYIKMILLKTSVLIATACKMGGIVAGASSEDCQLLYDFGLEVGRAFQMQDDWLDTFGNSDKTGKRVGGDILANKKTFVSLRAFAMAEKDQKDQLLHWYSTDQRTEKKVENVLSIFRKMGVDKLLNQEIEASKSACEQLLSRISAREERKRGFYDFLSILFGRDM